MAETVSAVARAGGKYKPFEEGNDKAPSNQKEAIEALQSFEFKPCQLTDEKS